MKSLLYFLVIMTGLCGVATAQTPAPEEDKRSLFGLIVEVVTPDLYDVKITLKTGEVLKFDKVASNKRSLEKKFVFRALDHTLRVVPDPKEGEKAKVRVIRSSDIEKIEIVKHKEAVPEPAPQPVPVPTPNHTHIYRP